MARRKIIPKSIFRRLPRRVKSLVSRVARRRRRSRYR